MNQKISEKNKRLNFFNNQIESIHKTMILINDDYMYGLFEMVDKIKNCIDDEAFLNNTRLEIIKIRMNKMELRTELLAKCEQFKEIEYYKKHYKDYIKEDEMETFLEYIEAIDKYLTCGINYFNYDFGKENIQNSNLPLLFYLDATKNVKILNKKYIEHIKLSIINYCLDMINDGLPKYFMEYYRKYMRLKIIYCK